MNLFRDLKEPPFLPGVRGAKRPTSILDDNRSPWETRCLCLSGWRGFFDRQVAWNLFSSSGNIFSVFSSVDQIDESLLPDRRVLGFKQPVKGGIFHESLLVLRVLYVSFLKESTYIVHN